MQKSRCYNLDFLRFVFSAVIVLYHLLHENIIPYTGGQERYLLLGEMTKLVPFIVDFFAVLGGFFLYRSYTADPDRKIRSYIADRFFRLWPVLALVTVITLIMGYLTLPEAALDLLFLRATGLSPINTGIIWYIGPFFWGSIIIFSLLKLLKAKAHLPVIAVIFAAGCGFSMMITGGTMGRGVVCGFVSLSLIRIISDLALGVLLAIADRLLARIYMRPLRFITAAVSAVEIVSLAVFFMILFGAIRIKNALLIALIISLIILSAVSGCGILARLFNKPFFGLWGKYTYSIYVIQQTAFYLFRSTIWKNSDLLYDHCFWSLAISTCLCIGIGIAVYYIVERPAVLLRKKLIKNSAF